MSNEWVRPPDEVDDPIFTFFSGGELAPFTPGIALKSYKSVAIRTDKAVEKSLRKVQAT